MALGTAPPKLDQRQNRQTRPASQTASDRAGHALKERMTRLRGRVTNVLPAGSVRARVVRGAFWVLIGSASSQVVTAVAGILVARELGKLAFGELAMIRSTVGMFDAVANLGVGVVASKFMAELRDRDRHRAGRILGLATGVGLVSGAMAMALVIALATPLSVHVLKNPLLAPYLRIGAVMLLVSSLNTVQSGALAGFEAFKKQAFVGFTISTGTGVFLVLGAYTAGIRGAIWMASLWAVPSFFISRWFYLSECRKYGISLQYGQAWSERSVLFSFGIPATLGTLMVGPVGWAAGAILTRTAGYEELGLFNAANQWRNVLLFLPAIIGTPLLPVMSQLYAKQEYARVRRVLIRSLFANLIISGTAAILLALASKTIMKLYGPQFTAGVPPLLAVIATAVLLSAGVVVGNLIAASAAVWQGFLFNAVWAAVLLASAAVLSSRFGALGLGLAYLLAYTVHTAIQLTYLFRRLRQMESFCSNEQSVPRG